MCILQLTGSDVGGGAEQVARGLFECYRKRGFESYLAVGYKQTEDGNVIWVPKYGGPGARLRGAACAWLQSLDGNGRLSRMVHLWTRPAAWRDVYRGVEDFHFPGTWRLLGLAPSRPDVLHCHNLHGGYFDLEALPWLSRQVPTLLTLHDAWLLSGHCAHSLGCERWRIGCGQCPDLTLYPSVRKDATAHNWRRKKEIYQASRIYLATPSRWLMNKVDASMLAPAVAEGRVIPHGVDLAVFHPADKEAVREQLAIAPKTRVLLFVAKGVKGSPWKDFPMLRAAVGKLAGSERAKPTLLFVLGEKGAGERINDKVEIRFVPHQSEPRAMARYYQAADLYVHAAKVDTFPSAVIEALACGAPVVATAVGGIPEQVKGAAITGGPLGASGLNGNVPGEATGVLVPAGDAESMAVAVDSVLADDSLRRFLACNASKDARKRFDREQQVGAYLNWYREILKSRDEESRAASGEAGLGKEAGRLG